METLIIKELLTDTPERKEFIEDTFRYWLSNKEHIRTPFPEYIHEELMETSTTRFIAWADSVTPKARQELNHEIVAEKFEEIIFETGLMLAKEEDEKITIRYPFMPRSEDEISIKNPDGTTAKSTIFKREIIKEGNKAYLKVYLKNNTTSEEWDTKFELPE
jgi:hypothetical protein